jgi:hypothetical protein
VDYNSQFPSLSLKFPIPRLLMESGNFNVMERLGLRFPGSEFEPSNSRFHDFCWIWEFAISTSWNFDIRLFEGAWITIPKSQDINVPSPPLHCRLTLERAGNGECRKDARGAPKMMTFSGWRWSQRADTRLTGNTEIRDQAPTLAVWCDVAESARAPIPQVVSGGSLH